MHILKCPECNTYGLSVICEACDKKRLRVSPARYSPEDKYADYRRRAKQNDSKK